MRAPSEEPILVTVVVPTRYRNASLARALASLAAQTGLEPSCVEIVIVDNSAEGTASGLVAERAVGCPFPMLCVHEPRPGLATARNVGLAHARGAFVAFLDDDEEAPPMWLSTLMDAARETRADAVFGPVTPAAEEGAVLEPFKSFFARALAAPDRSDVTDLHRMLGTGNSLFRRATCFVGTRAFEPALDAVGGEDSLFLTELAREGRRFVWAARAEVVEWIPAARATWSYVRRRRFLSGQIRTFVHTMTAPADPRRVVFLMALGLAQTLVAAAAAAATFPFDRTRARRFSCFVYGGLGKIFWMRRLRPELYGRARRGGG